GIDQRTVTQSQTIDALAGEVLAEMRKPKESGGSVYSGLLPMDTAFGGWRPGEQVILAARTGQGKTSLATQIALHNAQKHRAVLIVSLEMMGEELASRLLCGLSGVDSRRVRAGSHTQDDITRMGRSQGTLVGLPLTV